MRLLWFTAAGEASPTPQRTGTILSMEESSRAAVRSRASGSTVWISARPCRWGCPSPAQPAESESGTGYGLMCYRGALNAREISGSRIRFDIRRNTRYLAACIVERETRCLVLFLLTFQATLYGTTPRRRRYPSEPSARTTRSEHSRVSPSGRLCNIHSTMDIHILGIGPGNTLPKCHGAIEKSSECL